MFISKPKSDPASIVLFRSTCGLYWNAQYRGMIVSAPTQAEAIAELKAEIVATLKGHV